MIQKMIWIKAAMLTS